MQDVLDGLTDAQKEAVTHINGPLLVIAGPGSGKTRVITRRIAYLVYCGIRPWNILAITFTNKAANEMRERVAALVTQKGVWLSTFHSFCARVLREFSGSVGYGRDFTIYDEDDSLKVIRAVMKEKEISAERISPRSVRAAISVAKERFLGPAEYESQSASLPDQLAARVYVEYQERLHAANAMDFDDLLMKTATLLERDPEALEKLRKRHQFVLVDEFQDTNRAQYVITRLLTAEHRNLCVTGDPDQSIYGWRGADISNILDFEKDYPEARVVFLDRNYRSTKTILAAADRVVEANTERKPRTLYTENPPGEKIHLFLAGDSREEAKAIATTASRLIAEGLPPRQIAVFYRVNALSREIEEAFVALGLPYQVVGGVQFYARKEIKDILAYLRLANNRADEVSLRRIINTPPRSLGPKAVETLAAWAKSHGVPLSNAVSSDEALAALPPKAAVSAKALAALLDAIAGAGQASAKAAAEKAIGASGYRQMLEESGDSEDKDRIDNLSELANAAAQFDEALQQAQGLEGGREAIPDASGLTGFLEQTALAADIDDWHDRADRITLMTMHAAKGLEFGAVLIVGLDEGILPHANCSSSQSQLEEERRVFFVAMTRAKERLYLFRADERMLHGAWRFNIPSRFLKEIPPELVQIETPGFVPPAPPKAQPSDDEAPFIVPPRRTAGGAVKSAVPGPGTRVRHREFGPGIVKSVTPQGQWHKMTVHFPPYGEKKLIFEKAGLEIIA